MQKGDPVEERYKENMERGPAGDQLVYCINSRRESALSKEPKFDHIDITEKEKVLLHRSHFFSHVLIFDCIVSGV